MPPFIWLAICRITSRPCSSWLRNAVYRCLMHLNPAVFDVLPVCDCNEARRMLETQPLVQVVVTDARLPRWRLAAGA